jgi:outer membrane biosynthesis protein TonB
MLSSEIELPMDVSYSAWRQSTQESLALKGDSFSFLFDRRYTNRLNRMSRVFFEAYARATKELAVQEDRFPSLSEIDAKMESGAVYAFKDRLTKNTEFFEEVKISGVSYLVPRAKRFADASGIYTDLAFSFDEGTVILPTRKKISSQVEPMSPEVELADQIEEAKPTAEEKPAEMAKASVFEDLAESKQPPIEKEQPVAEPESLQKYPSHIPEPFMDVADKTAPVPSEAESVQGKIAKMAEQPLKADAASKDLERTAQAEKASLGGRNIKIAAVLGAVIILLFAGAYFMMPSPPAGAPQLVEYSAYLSNATQGNYLGLDIKNSDGFNNEMEMVLPANIDQNISSRGGVITISHAGNTFIRLNSSTDASIRLYLSGNWTAIPTTLNLVVPNGYDSGLVVNATDYDVKRKDNIIILRFDCTREGVTFEQSYSPKR